MKEETIRTGITLPESMHLKAKDYASKRFGGNVSALVQAALKSYMGEGDELPDTNDSNILVELTARHVPFFMNEMKAACGKNTDQPKELAALLMNYAGAKSGASKEFLKTIEETRKMAQGLTGIE